MPVPTKNQLHRVVLEIAAGSAVPLSRKDVVQLLSAKLSLTEEDMAEQSSSGVFRVADRTDWAMFDLRRAGYLHRPTRGRFVITEEGRAILRTHEGEITDADLRPAIGMQKSESVPAQTSTPPHAGNSDRISENTPIEQLQINFATLQEELTQELIDSVRSIPPPKFEQLVVDLLEKMGYGHGESVGRSGDGGIDGIIDQDALGLEKVYVQAKRYTTGSVGEPEIRNFAGSMIARGATKGVFITTSQFSSTAIQTAKNVSQRNETIRLVAADELALLMVRHGVGVVTERAYEIKKLDENYFAEEI